MSPRSKLDVATDPAEQERPKKKRGRPPAPGLLTVVEDVKVRDEDQDRIAAWQERFINSIGEYDAGEFYVRSTDHHGHMDKTSISFPQGTMSLIAQVVDEVPYYSSTQAFFRDAVIHRMAQLCHQFDVNERLKNSIDIERQGAGMDMVRDNMNRQKAEVERFEDGLTEAERAGDWAAYDELLDRVEFMIPNLNHPFSEQMEAARKRGTETFMRHGRDVLEAVRQRRRDEVM